MNSINGSSSALIEQYFDPVFYLEQSGGEATSRQLDHYLTIGAKSGLSPCKYFDQTWYSWQNPDFRKTHENCFLHYLELGRYQGRDPSPLVDMVRFTECFGENFNNEQLGDFVLRSSCPPGCGVYANYGELEIRQKKFFEAIQPIGIRTTPPAQKRKNLVFLQAGPSGLHANWFDKNRERNWDICINLYDARAPLLKGAEYIIAQSGTKATAMSLFQSKFGQIADDYDYILFLDDDITVEMETIDRLFKICAERNLDLAQMSLSERSNCIWPLFYTKRSGGVRFTNGVEIMMPVLSGQCFAACRDLLGKSISGFGLDLAIGKRASELGSNNIAVLDQCVVEHLRPIDTTGGALYSYLRSVGINPKAELWLMKKLFDTHHNFVEIGCT